jgi:hypothetical protein
MKNTLLALLTTSALLIGAQGTAHAAWKELGSNAVMTVYVDLDTVQTQGEKTQIISMLDFKKPGTNPSNKEAVNSIIGLNEYDCPQLVTVRLPIKNSRAIKARAKWCLRVIRLIASTNLW